MIEWFGDAFLQTIKGVLLANLEEAGRTYVDAVWAKIGIPVFPRSLPGEPPRTDTGTLRESFDFRVGELNESIVMSAGTPVYYGLLLEQGGTSNWGHVEPRPFILNTFLEMSDELATIILTT